MDKKLTLYKIPDLADITNALTDSSTPPQTFYDGDIYIDTTANTVYKANGDSSSSGTWQVVVMPQYSTTKYRVLDAETPTFWGWDDYAFVPYDTSFPSGGRKAEIYDFTYSAQRMGIAPTISATLMYDYCLDDLWTNRVCVYFNGTFFFIDRTPTSSKENTDVRYKHDITLTSEKILLENVYLMNTADPNNPADRVNDWTEFSIYADINLFVSKLNRSLEYSGLGRSGVGFYVVVDTDPYTSQFIADIEEKFQMFQINNTYLKDALDLLYNTFGVPYYYDGYTIHIGFSSEPAATSAGITLPEFEYGHSNQLLTISKNINSDGIVNRITGKGSGENIPYFYPNQNPNALDIHYWRSGSEVADAAKIINPYNTSNLTASTGTPMPTPDGSYFKYGLHTTNYILRQSELLNPVYLHDNTGRPVREINANVFMHVDSMDDHTSYYYHPLFSQGHYTGGFVTKMVCFKIPDNTGASQTNISITDSIPENFTYNVPLWSGGSLPTETIIGWEERTLDYTNIVLTASVEVFLLDPSFNETYFNLDETQATYQAIMSSISSYNSPTQRVFYDYWINQDTTTSAPLFNNAYWQSDPNTPSSFNNGFPINITNIGSQYKRIVVVVGYKLFGSGYWSGGVYHPDVARMWSWGEYENNVLYTNQLRNLTNTEMSTDVQTYGWLLNNSIYSILYNYGIKLTTGTVPTSGDIIYFTSAGLLPMVGNLMPTIYRNTGGIWYNATNNTYPKTNGYYTFENEYVSTHAKELVENFDDIKPTIKGMMNGDTPPKRIDKFLAFAFDQNDNNERNENGELLHPYFCVKLARTNTSGGYSFNLFDCGVDSGEMTINMTSGECGGCAFKIAVQRGSNGFMTNTVGVFAQATTINGVTYPAGTPMRYTSGENAGNIMYNQDQSAQQDTENNEVWIALMKDDVTFSDSVYPVLNTAEPTTSDTFVITNILLPYAYVIAAENRLEKALLDSMEEKNPEKFSFSIDFSRPYYANNYIVMDEWVDESSKLKLRYNSHLFSYFVTSYSYKMSNDKLLPAVNITLDTKAKALRSRVYDIVEQITRPVFSEQPNVITGETPNPPSIRRSPSFSAEYNNSISIENDVVFQNGRSLIESFDVVLNEIELIKKGSDGASIYSRISNILDTPNLFKDGMLKYGFNKISDMTIDGLEPTDISITAKTYGVGKKLVVTPESGGNCYIEIGQHIGSIENGVYTASLTIYEYELSESAVPLFFVNFYDEVETLISTAEYGVVLGSSETQNAFSFVTPEGCTYFRFGISISNMDAGNTFSFSDIMVFVGQKSTVDTSGQQRPSSTFPSSFVDNKADLDLALESTSGKTELTKMTLSGIQDGSNRNFYSNYEFQTGSSNLFLNGQRLELNTDYTETSSNTIQIISAYAPYSTDKITLMARKK